MKRLCYLLPLLIITSALHAQEARTLSLQEAMDYAVKHNPNARNARLDVLITMAQANQVKATALPRITGKGELDDYFKPPVTFFPNDAINLINPNAGLPPGEFQPVVFTPKYALGGSLSGNQTLFDGSLIVALQAQKAVLDLVRQTGSLTIEGIRYNVSRAYYALVIAQRQFAINNRSLATARDVAHDLIVTREAGMAEKIEVDRSNVQVNNLATDSLRAASLLDVSEQLLKYQMGMNLETPIQLTDTSLEHNLADALELANEDVPYEQRTEYNVVQGQLRLNEYNLKRYKFAALPTLNIFANTGYTYSSDHFSDLGIAHNYVYSLLAGVQLNVPIFNGFLRTNQVREAKLHIEKTKDSLDFVKQTIDFQTAQARTTLKNTLLQVEKQNQNLELANTVLDLARKKYKAGVGSNLEVNQAQSDLLTAQNSYFQTLLDVANAQTDLQKALGQFK